MDIRRIQIHLLDTATVSVSHEFHRLAEHRTTPFPFLYRKILEEKDNKAQAMVWR